MADQSQSPASSPLRDTSNHDKDASNGVVGGGSKRVSSEQQHPLAEEEPQKTVGDDIVHPPPSSRQLSFISWDEAAHDSHHHHHHKQQASKHSNDNRSKTAGELGRGSSTTSGSDDLELLDDDDDDDDDGDEEDDDLRAGPDSTRSKGGGALYARVDSQEALDDDEYLEQVEASLLSPADGSNGQSGAAEAEEERRRRRRRKTRRVYGGGKRLYYADGGVAPGSSGRAGAAPGSKGQRSIAETSYILFVNHISPGFALIVPYAYSLTGISFGIPLTVILLALGASFAQLILTVEARYVGAGSYPALASSVFPHVLKIQYLGEVFVNLFVAFVGLARTLIAMVLASDLLIQLLTSAFPNARILHSYIFVTLIMGLAYLIPSLLTFSSSTRPRFPTSLFLSQLPSLSALLYPLTLFILAISLKNLEDYPSLLKPGHDKIHWRFPKPHFDKEPLHTPTLWSGVSILLLACASSQGSTFEVYRGLRKRALPGAGYGYTIASASTSDSMSANTSPSSESLLSRLIQRHRWELATSLAVLYTSLLYIFSGLIGYLNLLVVTPNIMTALPLNHAWFNVCRVFLLLTILPLISDTNTRPARIAIMGLLDVPRKLYVHARSFKGRSGGSGYVGKSSGGKRRPRSSTVSLDGGADSCSSSEDEDAHDDHVPTGASRVARAWQARVAILIIWAMVIVFACLGHGFRNVASVSEAVGCVGITWLSFILPSAFHIILFHVRRPRTIFVSDASAPDIQSDTLLLSKESQLQKRLMGKRIWMDLVAFGLLLPFGIIGFARGIWALAS